METCLDYEGVMKSESIQDETIMWLLTWTYWGVNRMGIKLVREERLSRRGLRVKSSMDHSNLKD